MKRTGRSVVWIALLFMGAFTGPVAPVEAQTPGRGALSTSLFPSTRDRINSPFRVTILIQAIEYCADLPMTLHVFTDAGTPDYVSWLKLQQDQYEPVGEGTAYTVAREGTYKAFVFKDGFAVASDAVLVTGRYASGGHMQTGMRLQSAFQEPNRYNDQVIIRDISNGCRRQARPVRCR